MISIEEAQKKVFESIWTLDPVKLPLDISAGLILAEDIQSDMDIPPFNRATMDGYAVHSADSGDGARLKVDGIVAAGQFHDFAIKPGHTVKIMTGAPVPSDVDSVIQIELTSEPQPGVVELHKKIEPGKNIALKGEEVSKGSLILKKGTEITAPVASVLAQAGQNNVPVYQRPSVLILSTGSELINVDEIPKPGQIRESNSFGLLAQCTAWGAAASRRPKISDTKDALIGSIEDAFELNSDIIVLTGGVSAGDYDLVPGILKDLGVKEIFHKVAQKPGKPVWFGKIDEILIFGLPGNPVAAYLGFELYAGPSIRRMMGQTDYRTRFHEATAAGEFMIKSDRAYLPASRVENTNAEWMIHPVSTTGSANIHAVVETNAFAVFEKGQYTIIPGERVKFFFQRGELVGT